MDRPDLQNYQMLTRVVDFGTRNVGMFPKDSAAEEIIGALVSAVSILSEQASSQVNSEASMRTSRVARSAARETLKRKVGLTVQTGRALKSVSFHPPLKDTDHALISSGNAFVLAAEP